jgi:gag-polypeptide of LTR copia-type
MTSALGTGLFLFVQGVNNDPAAILRIIDTKYQGTDTSSVMSAVNEVITKKCRPGQHMEMFVAEFEGLAIRLEAIGHGVSKEMRVINFLNSLSEISALSADLSALRVIDNHSKTKATTQILSESELQGVNNNGPERPERAMVANNGFTGTCYTCGEVGHRCSDLIDRGRHQRLHPMFRYGAHGGGHHTDRRQGDRRITIVKVTEVLAKEVRATKQTIMHVAVKDVTSIVSASEMMATTIGATPRQHLTSKIITVIPLTIQTLHRTTISSTAPLQPLWPRTMLATNSTRRQLWSIPVPRDTFSTICPSSINSSLSHPRLSSWATTRQPTMLRLERLCSTCMTGDVSALPKSFMCLASSISS